MLPKSPLVNSFVRYLRQAIPHRPLLYIVLAVALGIASIPWWHALEWWDSKNLVLMAIPILGAYWIIQSRIMQSAVCLARYDRKLGAPDILLGTVPQDAAIFAQVRAILRHYWLFIVGITFALLTLSLSITVYLYYLDSSRSGLPDRGFLKYVGVVSSAYGLPDLRLPTFPYLQWPVTLLLAGIILLILTCTNSILSASMGLWTRHLGQTIMDRIALSVIFFALFLGLFALRETPALQCLRSWMLPSNRCDYVLFQMRLIDSFQEISLTFEDGGAASVTGVHLPAGRDPYWEGYQWRHLLVGVVTIFCQLALSAGILWRVIIANRRKKLIWLFGSYGNEYYLWRYR